MDRATGHGPAAGGWVQAIGLAVVLLASVVGSAPSRAGANNPGAPDQPQGPVPDQPRPAGPAPAISNAAPAATATAVQTPLGSIDWEYSSLGVYGPTFTSSDRKNKLTLGLFV